MSTDKDNCSTARQVTVRYQSEHGDDSLFQLALGGLIEGGLIEIEDGLLGDAAAEDAVRHIECCNPCQVWLQDWLDALNPDRAARRERLSKYCCVSMFAAVTDPRESVRFSFTMFRGEDACWCINDQYTFARFCPWCGEGLPNDAFEPGLADGYPPA